MSESASASHWHSPILRSVVPVVEQARFVEVSTDEIERVADWLAHEELAFPSGSVAGPLSFGTDPWSTMDGIMLVTTLNFAFTDFGTGVKYSAERAGVTWSDSEGMVASLLNAKDAGIPVDSGAFMASVDRATLERVFSGNIEMPMLDERVAILNDVGAVLCDRYGGRFSRFVRDCAPAMYAAGDGVLERLVDEFPRFDDSSDFHGRRIQFHKLAQLGMWQLHAALHQTGVWGLRDLGSMTAFADYIVPVALRLMRIVAYRAELEDRINAGVLIGRDSDEEVEIRAATIVSTALLTDAVNRRRGSDRAIVIPQLDYRLWSAYHVTTWPHHLTRTIMY